MKNVKKPLALLLTSTMLFTTLFSGCGSETPTVTPTPENTGMKDGSYTASTVGFGGDISVSITVSDGSISKVTIVGDDETPAVGGAALETLADAIKTAQSADIDSVSGATVTSSAVIAAAKAAIAEANGEETAELKIADGTYTASAWGFSPSRQLTATVTIADGKMAKIDIDRGGETEIIINTALESMVPEMLSLQSVRVDATSGATVSSGAIKTAVEDCLVQAIQAAGGDPDTVTAFYVPSVKVDAHEIIDTDILVVGMGGSGIMTGGRAAETLYLANNKDASAVNVLMIDKAAKFGGTSATTAAPMAINPASFVEANGGKDYVDAEVLKADWIEYTEGDAQEWAIDAMMQSSGAAVDYLMERGFVFGAPAQGLSSPYEICCSYGGGATATVTKNVVQSYFDAFVDKYVSYGGKYQLNTEATDLIVDENGAITGVKAVGSDGTEYTINAKYVVLATGGFAGNGEMEDTLLSDEYYNLTGGGQWKLYGMTQNDGKMIQSALDHGASTYNIGMPPVSHIGGAYKIMHKYPVIEVDGRTKSLNDIPMMMAVAPNSLAINRQGVRFQDETTLAAYGNWAAGAYFYSIWSDEQIKSIQNNGLAFNTIGIFINQGGWPANTPIPEIYDILDEGIAMDYIFKADTLEELAAEIGVPADTLVKTVSDYNTYCDTKTDPADGIEKNPVIYSLGGQALEGDYNVYEKVEGEGPYYAVKGAPWIYSTVGALNVNEDFQVLDTEGQAMTGLYAVGTDCLGMLFTEKKEYVTYGGADQGWAFTSGYLAGEGVANALLNR